jgi:hypothetical protein
LYQFTKRVIKMTSFYRGISLLSTSCNIFSNILLSRLSLYIDEIIGDHQCGFRRNRLTNDQMLCIHQILEKKWDYNETVYQLFVDVKEACVSVRREELCNILIRIGVPMKIIRFIQMCLIETYNIVRIGKYLFHKFPIQSGLKQGDALW